MKPIKKICLSKLEEQGGRCFYCELPIWVAQMERAAAAVFLPWQLQCTAEHLIARCDGGTNRPENIVAACRFCNSGRHRRKKPRTAEVHRAFVRQRMAAGKWLARFLNEPSLRRSPISP